MRKRDSFEDKGIDGRIILKSLLKVGLDSVDRIDLAQDRDRWRALVNAIIKLWVP
jgi:hypothetical protein